MDLPLFPIAQDGVPADCEKWIAKVLHSPGLHYAFMPKDVYHESITESSHDTVAVCTQHHDVTQNDCQQTLRCLYYHSKTDAEASAGLWRAGAHTDFDTLTLLFQRPGESGMLLLDQGQQVAANALKLHHRPSTIAVPCIHWNKMFQVHHCSVRCALRAAFHQTCWHVLELEQMVIPSLSTEILRSHCPAPGMWPWGQSRVFSCCPTN